MVRVKKERIYSKKRKRRASGIMKSVTGQLKNRNYAEKSRRQSAMPTPAPQVGR
jgi:hypothetical protein